MTARTLLTWALAAVLATAPALAQNKKSHATGTWEIKAGSETFRITLAEDEGDISGTLTLPNGETAEIEYGLAFGKEIEFTTVENGVEYEWTAEVSRNSIKGERVNLDDETAVAFTAKRIR